MLISAVQQSDSGFIYIYIGFLFCQGGGGWVFPAGSAVKNLPANTGDTGSILGSRRCPGEGNGNPFQYSCLENPMERGTWRTTVHGVAKIETT